MISPRARAARRPYRRMILDADSTVVLDQHARSMRAGLHNQIRTCARGFQIGFRRAPTPLVVAGRLVIAATFLTCAIEVGIARNASLHAGLQHGVCQFQAFRLITHVQRSADAVELIGAMRLVLRLLEERQDGIPVPIFAASLAPFIVIAVAAAYIHHAVDRAAAAERLATRQIQFPTAELRLWLGLEPPVHRWIDVGLGEAERDVDPRIAVRRPGFQEQHTVAAGF